MFTGGVGENSAEARANAVKGLEWLGIRLDNFLNSKRAKDARLVSSSASTIAVLVVPTNEELEIARQAAALL